jgi:hypothetical protein
MAVNIVCVASNLVWQLKFLGGKMIEIVNWLNVWTRVLCLIDVFSY